ncbi:hypothetical protein COV11_01320 [Candidatus Woesearchaeota archaeon CG10_big_fil_rev_8_21_14_0_10_30_7]|nr:MAG: hypothetical protein COV11_01320 [Candidatus Woesearchaeota archaeon CG10_big_fil_rev_8_21_14_0_10_30_7]
MDYNNSKIDLIAYQGQGLPTYLIDGTITNRRIHAKITSNDNKEVGKLQGIIGEFNMFFFQLDFKHLIYRIDVSGRLNEDPSEFRIEINGQDQVFDVEGSIDSNVSLDFTLYSLDYGIAEFLIGGSILQ